MPSRIVVGYHGGKYNDVGDFIEVRYSDAHAWSEAFINGSWVRFDATAATSPERIEYGMEAILEIWGQDSFGGPQGAQALANFLNPNRSERALRRVIQTWSNVQYQWKKWVVDYDSNTQKELLEKLGLSAKNSLYSLIGVLVFGVTLLLGVYFWQLLPKPKKLNQTQRLYQSFLSKARKSGASVGDHLTPNELAHILVDRQPASANQIREISSKFNLLSFGQTDQNNVLVLEQLKKALVKLKLEKVKT